MAAFGGEIKFEAKSIPNNENVYKKGPLKGRTFIQSLFNQ